jgi:hypothetical protein
MTKQQLFDALRLITEDQLEEAFNTIPFDKVVLIHELSEARLYE